MTSTLNTLGYSLSFDSKSHFKKCILGTRMDFSSPLFETMSCASITPASNSRERLSAIAKVRSNRRLSVVTEAKLKDKEEVKKEKKDKKIKLEVLEETTNDGNVNEEEAIVSESAIKKQSKEEKKAAKKAEKEKLKGFVLKFAKYQGLGNDFLLVDNRDSETPKVTPEQAVKICDRNFGVGADGVIFALPGSNGSDYTMRIFNSDGSEPEMCGNGIRCLARFVAELEGVHAPVKFTVHTLAGKMVVKLREDGQVKVDMGHPTLKASEIPTTLSPSSGFKHGVVAAAPLLVDGLEWKVTCVSMGNPHCITFSNSESPSLDVDKIDLSRIGPLFEHNPVFPARTNTEFVEVLSRNELKMRVWERGAGATLACGTGACALVVAAVIEGRAERNCLVHLPGGPLEIEWLESNNRVYMTGPAELVFEGKVVIR